MGTAHDTAGHIATGRGLGVICVGYRRSIERYVRDPVDASRRQLESPESVGQPRCGEKVGHPGVLRLGDPGLVLGVPQTLRENQLEIFCNVLAEGDAGAGILFGRNEPSIDVEAFNAERGCGRLFQPAREGLGDVGQGLISHGAHPGAGFALGSSSEE